MHYHTVELQFDKLEGGLRKSQGKTKPQWHHFELSFCQIHICSRVHKPRMHSLCMSLLVLFGIDCIKDRRLCDPKAGSSACHSCLCEWCVSGGEAWGAGGWGLGVDGRVRACTGVPTGVGCGRGVGLAVLHCGGHCMRCCYCSLSSVQVSFFLELAYVLLVPDSLVAEPVGYLGERAEGEPRCQTSSSQGTVHWAVWLFQDVWVHQVPNSQPLQ